MNLYQELGKLDKITKNNIANIKNHTATVLGRTIAVAYKLDYKVGDIIVLDCAVFYYMLISRFYKRKWFTICIFFYYITKK